MVDAKCQNDGCERGVWSLRKHPSQYKRGVTCPDCGTTRVTDPEGNPLPTGPQQQQSQAPAPARQQPQQAPQPAQQGQQGGMPARPNEQNLQQGVGIGETVYDYFSGGEQERQAAASDLLQVAGVAAAQFGQRKKQELQEGRQRAQNTSNDQLQRSNKYPECPECSVQIKNVPESGEFACPGCGVILERSPGEGQSAPQQHRQDDERTPQPGEFQ